MKKIILITLASCFIIVLKAQTISPQLVSFCSNTISGGGFRLDYSLGEIVTTTISVITNKLTQGFLQPDYNSILGINEIESGSISIYPNPSNNIVNIKVNKWQLKSVIFYNLTGKSILQSNSELIDISALTSGIYFAVITTDEAIQRIKIVKL